MPIPGEPIRLRLSGGALVEAQLLRAEKNQDIEVENDETHWVSRRNGWRNPQVVGGRFGLLLPVGASITLQPGMLLPAIDMVPARGLLPTPGLRAQGVRVEKVGPDRVAYVVVQSIIAILIG